MSETKHNQRRCMILVANLFCVPAIIKLLVMEDWPQAAYTVITYLTFALSWKPEPAVMMW